MTFSSRRLWFIRSNTCHSKLARKQFLTEKLSRLCLISKLLCRFISANERVVKSQKRTLLAESTIISYSKSDPANRNNIQSNLIWPYLNYLIFYLIGFYKDYKFYDSKICYKSDASRSQNPTKWRTCIASTHIASTVLRNSIILTVYLELLNLQILKEQCKH